MTDPTASLTFLPWVRQGVAAAIKTADTLGATQKAVVDLHAVANVNGSPAASVTVRLRGPADVVGIDANQVIRTDPHPGTADFEPNYFPCIEFDRPDFPWLFTPAAVGATPKLRPWLCLVVVRKQDGVTLGSTPNAPLPTLQIGAPATLAGELPNLAECWAWAHAQAAAADSTADPVKAALAGPPEQSLSRLICPRILAANTDYIACVVPTFELGRRAGLGMPVADADLIAASALAPAWSTASPMPLLLPVYYHWEFRTGVGGDFASLAARLRPRAAPTDLGHRPIDISSPGFPLPQGFPAHATLAVEGALRPLGSPDKLPDWPASTLPVFQDNLAAIINTPGVNAVVQPGADPILAPPLYGGTYAARTIVSRTGTTWLDQLNLDPRLRSVAAFGTRVIQVHQEALAASAWEQAGEVQQANQRLRQLQMSLVVGDSLQVRHFARLGDEAALRVSAPAFGRIGLSAVAGTSMYAQVKATPIPLPALSASMRRTGRMRGPMTRRVAARGGAARSPATSWVAMLAGGTASLPVLTWFDLVTIGTIIQHMPAGGGVMSFDSVTSQMVSSSNGRPWFVIRPEGQPVPMNFSFPYHTAIYDSPSARAFRAAATDHLNHINPGRSRTPHTFPSPVSLTNLRGGLTQGMQPRQTVTALAQRVISAGVQASPAKAPRVAARTATALAATTPADLDTITVTPTYPQPMYEPLRDLSQDLLLPGLDGLPADTVLGLETNRRFVEAYMVGLNVEMGRELLWRGFPINQLGTYFDHFWGGGPDIKPLDQWATRPLADPPNPAPRENFVMLMRSVLLRRYPNALIYLARAIKPDPQAPTRRPSEDPAQEKQPVFIGGVQPDISFFGFDVTPDQAVGTAGDPGYYVVIQQHPTEPRFGIGTDVTPGSASHLSIAAGVPAHLQVPPNLVWGRSAAHMAGITRRRPVRLAIHASQFL